MALRHIMRRGSGAMSTSVARKMARGGGGPPMPIFQRNKPIDFPLVEDHELVWNDGVAAETCLDFDAPHLSRWEGLAWWAGGLAFFASFLGFNYLSDPESKRLAVQRINNLPETAFDPRSLYDSLGKNAAEGGADDK